MNVTVYRREFSLSFLPVVTRADLIAAGLQVGCIVFTSAAMPDMWGHAIEVPDSMLKLRAVDSC